MFEILTTPNVILIDCDFLNASIDKALQIYRTVYPNRTFPPMALYDLLDHLSRNGRIDPNVTEVTVLFVYKDDEQLHHCNPSALLDFIDDADARISSGSRVYRLHSVWANFDQTVEEYFSEILQDTCSIHETPLLSSFERVVILADNIIVNETLEMLPEEFLNICYMLRPSKASHITLPIPYTNIAFPIGFALGLKREEL